MLKKFSKTDKILFLLAISSLVFSEILFFTGDKEGSQFVGLWVPTILAFGIYLKLIKSYNNDWIHTLFCRDSNFYIWDSILFCNSRIKKIKLMDFSVQTLIKIVISFSLLNVWLLRYKQESRGEGVQREICMKNLKLMVYQKGSFWSLDF